MNVRAAIVSAVFVAGASALFIVGNERESEANAVPALFLASLALHALYGAVANTFWALAVALVAVPVVVAASPWEGYDTPPWVLAAFAEGFYGVPLVFIGVIGRRLWQARRPRELSAPLRGEDTGP